MTFFFTPTKVGFNFLILDMWLQCKLICIFSNKILYIHDHFYNTKVSTSIFPKINFISDNIAFLFKNYWPFKTYWHIISQNKDMEIGMKVIFIRSFSDSNYIQHFLYWRNAHWWQWENSTQLFNFEGALTTCIWPFR